MSRIRIASENESQLGSFRVRNDLGGVGGVKGEKVGWGFYGELDPA